jgi:hypothetical protein
MGQTLVSFSNRVAGFIPFTFPGFPPIVSGDRHARLLHPANVLRLGRNPIERRVLR